jgi:8-oxo-dGTP pyrophosphatase MutT (NUDIX family)
MSTGSGIIFWVMTPSDGPAILVGKESIYVRDLTEDSTRKETAFGKSFGAKISELETTPSIITTEEDAKLYFRRGAQELERLLRIGEIRYDTPHLVNPNQWTVNYRYLPKDFKRGIIKGRREGSENAKQVILREIAEELGFRVGSTEATQMVNLGECRGYTIFSLEITDPIVRNIKQKVDDRKLKKSGEVFDLDFKLIPYLKSPAVFGQLNDKTACSIDLFERHLHSLSSTKKAGGIRKRSNKKIKNRKTKNRKNRKTKKTRK